MKRISATLLALSFLLTFCACQTGKHPTETFTETEVNESRTESETGVNVVETSTEEETQMTETETETIEPRILYGWDWTNETYTYINGELTPWIGDIEEYQAFVCCFEKLLPDSFVAYDQLSEFGKFGGMVILSYDGSQYTYEFNDYDPQYTQYDYGVYNIYMRITHLSEKDSRNILDYKSEAVRDKIHHETGELSYLSVSPYDISVLHHLNYHDILYTYDSDGELIYMDMIIDNYRIFFSQGSQKIEKEYVECYFKHYSPSKPNFITLLLSGAEYEEVADAFRQMIATDTE